MNLSFPDPIREKAYFVALEEREYSKTLRSQKEEANAKQSLTGALANLLTHFQRSARGCVHRTARISRISLVREHKQGDMAGRFQPALSIWKLS
jgi:hypothetical protein